MPLARFPLCQDQPLSNASKCSEKQNFSQPCSPVSEICPPPVQSANAPSIPPPLWGRLTTGAPRPQKDLAYCWTFPRQRVLVTIYKQRTTTTKGEKQNQKENTWETDLHTHREKAGGRHSKKTFIYESSRKQLPAKLNLPKHPCWTSSP